MQVGKSVMRVAKNSIKGYSDTQTKVRDATSNDPWGPSGTQMSEIAALSYNQNDFVEIMEMLDKRLNDKGKNWRHVFKSLTLLDYLLHAGSENVVMYFRENAYVVKTLKEFQHIDEEGKDQGANVRQKAKDITSLLLDENRLRTQRKSRAHMRDRMEGGVGETDDYAPPRSPPPRATPARTGRNNEDSELQRAIEASKRSAEEEAARKKGQSTADSELEEAMRLSREEEEKRKTNLDDQNAAALFDDGLQQPNPNSLIDVGGQWQQPMVTGMQFQSYNPYLAQQQAQQEEWNRQQQLLEMQRQQAEQQQYQMMLAQQQAQAQAHYEQQAYLQQQQMQQAYLMQQQTAQQPLMPQQTAYGSNNPFAAFSSSSPAPAMPAQQQQQPQQPIFSAAPATSPAPAPQPAPTPTRTPVQQRPPRDDGKHAELARLLASGEGIDSFGNVGQLRYGQSGGFQQAQPTGTNPFGQRPQQQNQQQQSDTPFFTL